MIGSLPLGPLALRPYGLAYILGLAAAVWLMRRRWRAGLCPGWSWPELVRLLVWAMLGGLAGARLGYVLIYEPAFYWGEPGQIAALGRGGFSFHGGLAGAAVAVLAGAVRRGERFAGVSDLLVPLVPAGLFFGRLGNFLTGELWGPVTAWPWGVVFPGAGPWPRHPAALYEAFFEGLVLFVIIWRYSARARPPGRISALFLIFYGLFRIGAEFFREPDPAWGYLAGHFLTVGQVLSLALVGGGLLWRRAGRADRNSRRAS